MWEVGFVPGVPVECDLELELGGFASWVSEGDDHEFGNDADGGNTARGALADTKVNDFDVLPYESADAHT